jgi:hypothetical protein
MAQPYIEILQLGMILSDRDIKKAIAAGRIRIKQNRIMPEQLAVV